ncbi:hypothetical protein LTS18_000964 [Coniosporium uncinatum]|uniref:Uncharacterized protein n=1 Tax=Coniosporium uncinatum TaxID=93489 RepID=A0ACC3D823_9PEZI|nr:hypothetical protein LTS18_000964 [Coniosporium uncinatum]
MSLLSSTTPSLRPTLSRTHLPQTQIRHATLLRRPKRPYTFTQLITLSDGSTFLHRTTSPQPVYKSTKDARNSPLWNPSSQKLMNVEEDEAGRLAGFRRRFGRGWDSEALAEQEESREGEEKLPEEQADESLLDLISGFGNKAAKKGEAKGKQEPARKSGKGKGGQK